MFMSATSMSSMGSSVQGDTGTADSPKETQTRSCSNAADPVRPRMDTPATFSVGSNSGRVELTLTGINVAQDLGPGGTPNIVSMQAFASNNVVVRPTVTYGGSGSTAVLSFEVRPGSMGDADMKIVLQDGCNGVEVAFRIKVTADVQDCVVEWSEWSCCSQTCRSDVFSSQGVRTRGNYVKTEPKDGGRACPALREERQRCGNTPCPVNCEAMWNEWSPCSSTCGEGTRTRTANVIKVPAYGGAACGTLSPQQEICQASVPCATNAQVGTAMVAVNSCVPLSCVDCLNNAGCDYDRVERRCANLGMVNQFNIALSVYNC
jgi:hypothetical protein